tara:strand:+ start:232 stop:552 length:321 start_codon:yes stop_codon:yes gene_type:complete
VSLFLIVFPVNFSLSRFLPEQAKFKITLLSKNLHHSKHKIIQKSLLVSVHVAPLTTIDFYKPFFNYTGSLDIILPLASNSYMVAQHNLLKAKKLLNRYNFSYKIIA